MEQEKMCCSIPQEVLDECWKTPRRLHNAIRMIKDELKPDLAQTPYTEIATWGRVRLLRYEAASPSHQSPVLMVPSIINKYYVLDLRPGQSFIEDLTQNGIPVYLIDWGTPGPQDRYATLEDHVIKWLGAAIRKACRDADVEAIHLLGYCVGGTFAIAHAALQPERVAGVIALTAPVNFHDEGTLSVWASDPNFDVEQLAESYGLVPADLLQKSFSMLNPLGQQQKMRSLWDRLWDDKFVEKFLALDEWLNDNVDFPGATYVKYIKELYRNNSLIKGEFELDGRPVKLENITCPVLTAFSTTDHIVPGTSASVLHDMVSSEDKTLLPMKSGHIGCTVGGKAKDNLWRVTREWLIARPCPPRIS
jgi:polyhydroxyalkanoate synthase